VVGGPTKAELPARRLRSRRAEERETWAAHEPTPRAAGRPHPRERDRTTIWRAHDAAFRAQAIVLVGERAVIRADLSSVQALQEIGPHDQFGWQPIQGPLEGFRLKTNLRYIRKAGYATFAEVPPAVVEALGYTGAIRLKNQTVTYLYR
jgi:hypothetical protein